METTPLDGYKKIIITILTLIAASLPLIIHDPNQAQAAGAFLVDVLGAAIISIVGTVYVIRQASIDKEKVKVAPKIASTVAQQEQSPKADSTPAQQPAVASVMPATPGDNYIPFDIDAAVGTAEESCRKDGVEVTPISRAFYYYPIITNFDLREVPKAKRIEEAKRLVDKAVELFSEAFKYQTKLPKPPTLAEANNYHTYLLKLKKDYEKANGLTCSDKTFDELRNLISYFNELYNAQDGLAQLVGKTVDWSIYSGKSYSPTQVGWDYVKLL